MERVGQVAHSHCDVVVLFGHPVQAGDASQSARGLAQENETEPMEGEDDAELLAAIALSQSLSSGAHVSDSTLASAAAGVPTVMLIAHTGMRSHCGHATTRAYFALLSSHFDCIQQRTSD